MLTMQFDKRIRQRAQHLTRTPPVIDPRRFAAIRRVDPAQNQFISVRQSSLGQNRMGGMIRRQVENRDDLALCGPLPDKLGPATPPKDETERIQKNGFPCTGFTGQHVEPRLKGKLQPVDDQHVVNFKCPQHCRNP